MYSEALQNAETTRSTAVASTDKAIREDYKQYLTPLPTAELAVSFFSEAPFDEPLRCLDLGAGTGILSVALSELYCGNVYIDAIELDPVLASVCDSELSKCGCSYKVVVGNVFDFCFGTDYDRVILNPPYAKLSAGDPIQEQLPVKSPNLYSAFLMIAIQALAPGGECVAIIPRSWMNGDYFKAFRAWLFASVSITAFHVYDSRSEIFSDTDVLQETMILKVSKSSQSPYVQVSRSATKEDEPLRTFYPFEQLVDLDDDLTIRIEPVTDGLTCLNSTLKEAGLCASTGKIVDFRKRDKLHRERLSDCKRLVYACNFTDQGFVHPVPSSKPQWISCDSEAVAKQLIGPGAFVVVKRFSSKEESRRLKAFLLDTDEPLALENHLNYIHAGTSHNTIPLDDRLAKGLTLWLNSSYAETWFRARSGSTQVNASDLNSLPLPALPSLEELGDFWALDLTQEFIDSVCKDVIR